MRVEDLRDDKLYLPSLKAWNEFCLEECRGRSPVRRPQPVVEVGSHPPFGGRVQLAFPMHWWRVGDLEEA